MEGGYEGWREGIRNEGRESFTVLHFALDNFTLLYDQVRTYHISTFSSSSWRRSVMSTMACCESDEKYSKGQEENEVDIGRYNLK